MGMSYFIFMEIFIDGKWVCMNHYRKNDSEEELVPVFESGSRSYFGNAFEKMQAVSDRDFCYNSLSQEIKEFIHMDGNGIPDGFSIYAVPIDILKENIPSGSLHDNNYYVLKNDVFNHEADGDEIDSFLTLEEYRLLDEEEKKSYQFYEWDDEYGYVYYFRKILEHAKWICWEYSYVNYSTDTNPIRFIAVSC